MANASEPASIKGEINSKLLYSPVSNVDSISSVCYMLIDDVYVFTDMETPVCTDTAIYTPQFPIYYRNRKNQRRAISLE